MPINYEMLGDRIRLVRTNRGYSQEELAEAVSLTRESINRIEKGMFRPKLETVTQIAGFLNIPVDYLVSNDSNGGEIDPGSEMLQLLLDCNKLEKKILVETMRSLKQILYGAGV